MESAQTSSTPKKETKGLGRLWKKFKTALKDQNLPPASTSATTSTPSKPKAEPLPKPAEPTNAPITIDPESDAAAPSGPPMQTDIDRRLERARALFKKYNFDVDESELKLAEPKPSQPTERVQKNIRMRVKYQCHNCNTTFGHEKICISCQHPRCSKCTRYPPRKPKGAKKEIAAGAAGESKKEPKCACHECQTGFELGTEECPNCHHKICEECLKEALVEVTPAPATSEPEKKPAPSEPIKAGEVSTS